MRNAILLHGFFAEKLYYDEQYPSASNSHWFPWLQKQLLIHEIKADTPEVARMFEMNWDNWVKEVERFEISAETTIVGHSMGGGFWLRYLSQHPTVQVDKVVLVAPWLNPRRSKDSSFFDFQLDSSLIERTNQLIVLASDDDNDEVKESIELIRQIYPTLQYKEFHAYGHFTFGSMKTEAFPELRDVIL